MISPFLPPKGYQIQTVKLIPPETKMTGIPLACLFSVKHVPHLLTVIQLLGTQGEDPQQLPPRVTEGTVAFFPTLTGELLLCMLAKNTALLAMFVEGISAE